MSREKVVNKYCKGCTFKESVLKRECNACVISAYANNQYCPCVNCLVKVTCNNKHMCNERLHYIENMNFNEYDSTAYRVYELGSKQRN